jgi:hypothetical protein
MSFKKVHALLAQRQGDFDLVFLQHELIWRWQKIVNDFQPAKLLICVLSSALHKTACLRAKSRRQ